MALVDVERRGAVAVALLNQPERLNALSRALMRELADALAAADDDAAVGAMVIAGRGRAFAAGADVRELAAATPLEVAEGPFFADWERLRRLRKPLVAAVHGFALGGGCELAMMCDLIVAASDARFGQPEIKLGLIPGAGGTQRLTRAVGKARAMELVLTGEPMTAEEAHMLGLVNRLVPAERVLDEAVALAERIAALPAAAVAVAKQMVLAAFATDLDTGLALERRAFGLLVGSADGREGTAAFLEKRPPRWQGR
jgi:enoyl-CoA hydratase